MLLITRAYPVGRTPCPTTSTGGLCFTPQLTQLQENVSDRSEDLPGSDLTVIEGAEANGMFIHLCAEAFRLT